MSPVSSSLPVPTHLELPLVALHLMRAKGDLPQAAYLAEHAPLGCRADRVTTILRAAVVAGGTQPGNWGEPLAALATASREFLATMRGTAFSVLLSANWRAVPLGVRVAANSAVVVVGTTGEGRVKPAASFALTDGAVEPNKVAVFVAVTDETIRGGGTEALAFLNAELKVAVGAGLDATILTLLGSGVTPVTAADTTPAAVLAALRAALAQVSRGAASRLVGAVGPITGAGLATLSEGGTLVFPEMDHRGGVMAGIQVVAIDGVPEDQLLIADGARIAGNLAQIELDASRQAALRLDDTAADPGMADVIRSLWAENMTGLRAECWWGCEPLDPAAVAVIDGLNFG